MTETIKWSASVQVENGPKLSGSGTLDDVDAYDKIVVSLEKETSTKPKSVSVQPGEAGDVKALLLMLDDYEQNVTYSVNEEIADASDRTALDSLQLFLGTGAVGLIKPGAAPQKIYFYNPGSKAVTATILVARTAAESS